MASSFVADLYLPIRKERGREIKGDKDQIASSRWMVALMGMLLTGFAIVTCVMQQSSGLNLVDFATGIMCFAYTGMLGVFLTAIFTKRGNTRSVLDNFKNQLVRDYVIASNQISASSFAVMHGIDGVLNYKTLTNGRYDSDWNTTGAAKRFIKNYQIKD
jgi:Na+/proline symporter